MKIRTRLALGVAAILASTIVALGVVLVTTVRSALVDSVDDMLHGASGQALRSPGPPGGPRGDPPPPGGPPRGAPPLPSRGLDPSGRPIAMHHFDPGGQVLFYSPAGVADEPASPPRLPPIPSAAAEAIEGRIVTLPAEDGSLEYRVLLRRAPNGIWVSAAHTLKGVQDTVDHLVQVLLLSGAIALAVAALASYWLIRQGLRPVDQMVDTAAAIAAGDLSRRVPAANPGSELGRLGVALNQMLAQIEAAMRVRSESEARLRQFVADAAHELRTPLTSLRGYAELYQQGALADRAAVDNAIGRILAESARMGRLVEDLLLLARLDHQRGLELERLDLVALLREATADFVAVEPARPLASELEGEAVVLGDPLRLRQVVDNLLANTRVHTPPGTPVSVAARRQNGHVAMVVADAGPGIPGDDARRVFERFWRADPSRVRRSGGNGLGLAIVASIVQAHGGEVDVASAPGHGATFTVRLPLAEPRVT